MTSIRTTLTLTLTHLDINSNSHHNDIRYITISPIYDILIYTIYNDKTDFNPESNPTRVRGGGVLVEVGLGLGLGLGLY